MGKHHFAKSGALLIYLSCIFDFIPAALFILLFPNVFAVSLSDAVLMAFLGMILTSAFVPYIWALQISNSGNSIPIFQTIPVFVFILSWVFLGESITSLQLLAAVLIIVSSTLVGFDFTKRRINNVSVAWMLFSSFVIALYSIGSKVFIVEYDWKTFALWNWIGSALLCTMLVLIIKSWRKESIKIIKKSPIPVLSIFFTQVMFQIIAVTVWFKAVSVGPSLGLVQTLNGLQPAFVLIYSLIAGYLFSQYFPKVKINRVLLFKFLMIGLIILGVYLLTL